MNHDGEAGEDRWIADRRREALFRSGAGDDLSDNGGIELGKTLRMTGVRAWQGRAPRGTKPSFIPFALLALLLAYVPHAARITSQVSQRVSNSVW